MQKLLRNQFRIGVFVLTGASLFLLAAFRFQSAREHSRAPAQPPASSSRTSNFPHVILWAWERPEKLDYIDPQKTGVAFLAETIYLRADEIVSRPRLQPLTLPAGATVIAVARIESERAEPPTLSPPQMKAAANQISELGSLPNVAMVQVDFARINKPANGPKRPTISGAGLDRATGPLIWLKGSPRDLSASTRSLPLPVLIQCRMH